MSSTLSTIPRTGVRGFVYLTPEILSKARSRKLSCRHVSPRDSMQLGVQVNLHLIGGFSFLPNLP